MYGEAQASFEAALQQVLDVVVANKTTVPGAGAGAYITDAAGNQQSFSNNRDVAGRIALQLLNAAIQGA